MPRQHNRLNALVVENATTPGLLADGNGLYLRVSKTGAKSWVFRYMRDGKSKDLGLGSIHEVSLAKAREKTLEQRSLLGGGTDPLQHKRSKKAAKAAQRKVPTFAECSADYLADKSGGWSNPKYLAHWESTLRDYCEPINSLPIDQIDLTAVKEVLGPIWSKMPVTANKIRGRIKVILDYAAVHNYRQSDNPAAWRGHLDKIYAKPSSLAKVKHFAALHYNEVPDFLSNQRDEASITAQAIEFLVLTAGRTGEVAGARWSEIDLGACTWTIPSDRMKGAREHRVPLASPAIAVIRRLHEHKTNDYVFPSTMYRNSHISKQTMAQRLKRLKYTGFTIHGFRSSFRDWAAETTNYPRAVCEMALAHKVGDDTENAYNRTDLLERRRRLMEDWSRHCSKESTVIQLAANQG